MILRYLKRPHSLLILLLFIAYGVSAQSISPQTLNTLGAQTKTSTFSLDYSVGEMVSIADLTAAGLSLNTWFLQSLSFFYSGEDFYFSLFPNPAAKYITIKGNLTLPGLIQINLMSLSGKIHYNSQNSYNEYFQQEFDMAAFSDGLYFIKLSYQSNDGSITKSATFKFVKVTL